MKRTHAGFTVIELLVVMAILAIIATFTGTAFLEYGSRQQFRTVVVEVSSLLKETRQRTVAAETSSYFGVEVGSSSLTVYEGAYIVGAAENQVYSFPGVQFQPSLTNATTTIVFTRLTGMPNATGTIVLLHERTNATTTITLSESGLVW